MCSTWPSTTRTTTSETGQGSFGNSCSLKRFVCVHVLCLLIYMYLSSCLQLSAQLSVYMSVCLSVVLLSVNLSLCVCDVGLSVLSSSCLQIVLLLSIHVLLSPSQGTALSKYAKKILLASKPAPVLESPFKGKCVCNYACICMCACLCVHVCACICTSACINVCVFVCVCMCVCACACTCVHVLILLCCSSILS